MSDSLLLLRNRGGEKYERIRCHLGHRSIRQMLTFVLSFLCPTLFKLFLVLGSMTNSVISRRTGIFAGWFVLIRKVGGIPSDNPATQEPSIQIYLWPVLMVLEQNSLVEKQACFWSREG